MSTSKYASPTPPPVPCTLPTAFRRSGGGGSITAARWRMPSCCDVMHNFDTGGVSLIDRTTCDLYSVGHPWTQTRIIAGGCCEHAWLFVAMASTLAGNLTVLGSVANLIVVQLARAEGVTIGFWEYFRVGMPLSLLTILLGLDRKSTRLNSS